MMNGCTIMKCKYWDGKTCISKHNICLYQTETKEAEAPETKRQRDELQKQNELLTLGLLQEKNKVRKLKEGLLEARNIICSGENTTPQAEERTEITEEKPLKEVRQ